MVTGARGTRHPTWVFTTWLRNAQEAEIGRDVPSSGGRQLAATPLTLCEFRPGGTPGLSRSWFVAVVRIWRASGSCRLTARRSRANASKRKAMSGTGGWPLEERRLERGARLRRGWRRLARPTRPRTRGSGADEAGRRVAGGVAPPGRPSGGDPGGEVAVGGAAAGSGVRRPRSAAGPRPEPEGRAALQAVVWRAGREGAEQLHGPARSGSSKTSLDGFQQCYNAQVALGRWCATKSWWWRRR